MKVQPVYAYVLQVKISDGSENGCVFATAFKDKADRLLEVEDGKYLSAKELYQKIQELKEMDKEELIIHITDCGLYKRHKLFLKSFNDSYNGVTKRRYHILKVSSLF